MENTKIIIPRRSPMIGIRQPLQHSDNNWQVFYEGSDERIRNDYWHSRRAFLGSYHFSEENHGFKEKLRRSMKEANKKVVAAFWDIGKGLSERRVVFRLFKFTLHFPSLAFVTVTCFTPWIVKKRELKH